LLQFILKIANDIKLSKLDPSKYGYWIEPVFLRDSEIGSLNMTVLMGNQKVDEFGLFLTTDVSEFVIKSQVDWLTNAKICCSLGMKPLIGLAGYFNYIHLTTFMLGDKYGKSHIILTIIILSEIEKIGY